MISTIFICLACCIICQRKREQKQNRCIQTVRATNRGELIAIPTNSNVFFNSNNNQDFSNVTTNSNQRTTTFESRFEEDSSNINYIYKPYGTYAYEDWGSDPPPYNTLKFK